MASFEDVIAVVNSSLINAKIAVSEDESKKYQEAKASYKNAIRMLEVVANRVGHPDAFNKIAEIKTLYLNRLDVLSDIEINDQKSAVNDFCLLHDILFDNEIILKINDDPQEKCPLSSPLQPYWQLRIIRNTIRKGGFLTPNLYIPKTIWYQNGSKIIGLANKCHAFEEIYLQIVNQIFPLARKNNLQIMQRNLEIFTEFSFSLHSLQNNLSKPFTYINEIVENTSEVVSDKSQVGKLAMMVTSLSKNVRRYAEVGYQRIGNVLPGATSEDEMVHYVTLIAELCDRCQVLDDWYQFVEQERADLHEAHSAALTESEEDRIKSSEYSVRFEILASMMTVMHNISTFMKDVVCEILLRDIEYLHERYQRKFMESFLTLPPSLEEDIKLDDYYYNTRDILIS